ncbi:Lethal(2) giant larvae protein 2 [Intoshia linei]|uniref:Lethal(2) giant larvae protein 2 n=1 Tax=Intoshia linei TaxID=1819745 RepID=A0A177ASD0_9BILA|nr:Lethal(2) giant larvae protein 2 [Intoshia linei]
MPRRDYGTKNTLSIMVSNIHVALDFTSRLVNFIVITSKLDNISLNDSLEISKNACNKKFCIILTEEEILCIDLEDYSEKSKFGLYYMPYMQSIHATPITCFYVYENPCQAFIAALRHMAEIDKISYLNPDKYIINGGNVVPNESCLEKMMVITGHEDGSVSFWTNVRGHLNLIYRFTTLSEYGRSNLIDYGMDEEIDEFPPFHKIGIFDPCSDDPRYSIRTILYDTCSKRLFVGCQAGQILIYQFENFEEGELDCEISKNLEYEPQKCVNEGECIDFGSVVTINITESQPLYKWKGNPKLNMSSFSNSKHTNLYTFSIYRRIQFNPPAAILLLKYNSDNEILTASTLHGIIIFDVVQNIVMIKKCTLTQLDYNDVGEGFPRQNSLKKSLRQSMRRIRIRRSRRNKSHKTKTFNQEHEVQIQSRSNKEPLSLIGRVCHFSMCKLLKYYKPRLCVWIGCSSGKILCYMLSFPQADQRLVNPVQCELAKTINIKHAAPIIYLTTLDENFSPFQNKDSIEPEENESVSQILLVCTEEQIKLFSIPQLSPVHKLKITARSGLKISTAKVVLLSNKQNYKENFLFVLFNNGKSDIFSLPQMKPLCSSFSRSIKDDNILAIKSAFMCNNGVCAFSSSVSEFQFFTLSNSINLVPDSVCNFVAGSTEKVNGSRSENGSKIENGTQLNGLTTDTTICSEMTIDSVKDYLLTPNINEPRKPLSPTIENVSVELDNIKS